MRKLLLLVLSLSPVIASAEQQKEYDWDFAIIDNPEETFSDFTDVKGFGFTTPQEAVSSICTDDFAPAKMAIRTESEVAVYDCQDWRVGKIEPDIRKI